MHLSCRDCAVAGPPLARSLAGVVLSPLPVRRRGSEHPSSPITLRPLPSSSSPNHLPAVSVNSPASLSFVFQVDFVHRLVHASPSALVRRSRRGRGRCEQRGAFAAGQPCHANRMPGRHQPPCVTWWASMTADHQPRTPHQKQWGPSSERARRDVGLMPVTAVVRRHGVSTSTQGAPQPLAAADLYCTSS